MEKCDGGGGAGNRATREQSFREAGHGKHYFCDYRPATKAAGLRRTGGQDLIRFKHGTAAGVDGNWDWAAAIAGSETDHATQCAERDHWSRHAGQTAARSKNNPR